MIAKLSLDELMLANIGVRYRMKPDCRSTSACRHSELATYLQLGLTGCRKIKPWGE
jgi:hypothetical protein